MKIDVYDTYATSKEGSIIHFDVFLPEGKSAEIALRYAKAFLISIGENADSVTSERCNFCHSEIASPEVKQHIEQYEHFILQMEGCPNSSSSTNSNSIVS